MGKISDAIRKEIPAEGFAGWGLGSEAISESALSLARALDNPKTSPNARAFCAKELRETLDRLRELAPSREQRDAIDDLADRRTKRLAAG